MTDRRGAPTFDDLFGGSAEPTFDDIFAPEPTTTVFGTPRTAEPSLRQSSPIQDRINAAPLRPKGDDPLEQHLYELDKIQYRNQSKQIARDADKSAAEAEAAEPSWWDVTKGAAQSVPDRIGRAIGGITEATPQLIRQTLRSVNPLAASLPDELMKVPLVDESSKAVGKQIFDDATASLEQHNPNVSGAKGVAYDVFGAFADLGIAVGASAITRNPTVGSAIVGAQVFGDRYAESIAAGRTDRQAFADGVMYALPEYLGEKIVIGKLMEPGGKFLNRTIKGAMSEGIQESATETMQAAYDAGVIGEDMTLGEAVERIAYSGLIGGIAGGGIGAVSTPFARREKPAGVIESVDLTPAPVTPEDAASPLPTDLIAQGKKAVEGLEAKGSADAILAKNRVPGVGSRVVVNVGGKDIIGTIRDAFVDESDPALGAQDGLSIDLDTGGKFKEYFADLRDAGAEIRGIDDVLNAPVTLAPEIEETPVSVTRPPASAGAIPGNEQLKGIFRAKESSGDDSAKNPRSSASGRYQFTKGTWEALGGDWANRFDVAEQERLMGKLLDQNRAALQRAGITPDAGNMYAAHHFGAGGAVEMTRNPDGALPADVVKANPHLKGMTNGQALAWAQRAAGGKVSSEEISDEAPVAETPSLADEALSTAQVEVPATEAAATQPSAEIGQLATQPTITDTPSGKGILIAGATPEQVEAIRAAVPKAQAVPNRSGALTYSKKYEAQIREALSSATPQALPGVTPQGDGTRAAPVRVAAPEHMDVAAAQVAEPTEAQAIAGNYKHGHAKVHGMDITLENAKGSTRRGTDGKGNAWETVLPAHYGYVKKSEGADGDQFDVYVGDNPSSDRVFVVDQFEPKTGKWDEHKGVLGVATREEAQAIYDAAFSDGSGPQRRGAITEMSVDEFKQYLQGDTTKPIGPSLSEARKQNSILGYDNAQANGDTRVSGMAADQGPLPATDARGLSAVRGSRDQSASGMGERLPGVSGASRSAPDTATFGGQDQGRAGLPAGQRAVGDTGAAIAEPTGVRATSDVSRQDNDRGRVGTADRDTGADAVSQAGRGVEPRQGAGSQEAGSGVRSAPADARGRDITSEGLGSKNRNEADDAARAAETGMDRGARAISADERAALETARSTYAKGSAERANADAILRRGAVSDRPNIARVERELINKAVSAKPKASANKIFTDEAAEKAREVLRRKLSGNQLNSVGIDPEIVQAGITLAGYHIEKGARSFAAYARAMIEDLGAEVRPYLRGWYEAIRYYPGMDAAAREMSGPEEIGAALAALEQGNGDQGATGKRDAASSPVDVQRASEDGGAGRLPAESSRAGEADVRPARGERTETAERGGEERRAPARDRGTGASSDARAAVSDRSRDGRGNDTPATDAATGLNWRIEPGSLDESRGAAQKARDNLKAIAIVKALDASGMPATREQQADLAKYVGWGGLKNAFNETNGEFPKGFERVGPELKQLLTTEEYETARRSIQYAHYTSEKVIRPMWEAALAMGFRGGKVFEPGMGTGNFLGMMPAEVAAASQYQGIEFDRTTARIAELLYPESGVRHADYTQVPAAKNAYDLVIGNPPFSATVIRSDPEYGKLGFVLHDFFFAKSLDSVKPGGLLMFVTSAGTMNKVGAEARNWMADRADLVGAVRLPGDAFKENAGTEVTTDIIVLRKRMPGEAAGDRSWTETVEVKLPGRDGSPVAESVNRYFQNNPDQVLGEEIGGDKLVASARYAVRAIPGRDLSADLRAALERIAGNATIDTAPAETAGADIDLNSTERKEGSYYIGGDGRLMQHRGGVGVPVEGRGKGVKGGISASDQERIRALVPIRDALRKVLGHDMAGRAVEGEAARKELNSVYDRFVQQHGPINKAEIRYQRPSVIQQEKARAEEREAVRLAGGFFDEGSFAEIAGMMDPNARLSDIAQARRDARESAQYAGREWDEGTFDPADMPDLVIVKRPNIDPFMDDQEGYRLRAIEHYNDDSGQADKGRIFYENVVTKERPPEINSANDALLYSLNKYGRPEIDEIARLSGMSPSAALDALGDAVFRVPESGETYQTREQYLSGNVRQKLDIARAAAARDASLQRNVVALEAVQPEPLGPADISASLGMPWIPADVIAEFATSLGLRQVTAKYREKLAQWTVSGDTFGAAARSEWGTTRRTAFELLNDALNRQDPKIFDTVRDVNGSERQVLNAVDTQAAQDKMREIRAKFSEWVWSDRARADRLVALYNENYNNLVAPVYDGSYLTTPGIAASWSWRPHQTRVVSRIIQTGNTYMAHAVGAGKTSAMIGAGMEMRRLGLVRKPMYAVPNHMLGQFTKEFYEQYPTARILVADERSFHTDRRKQFVANMATEDLDAVIITHSAFGFIPMSEEFTQQMLRDQVAEYREILSELKADKAERITIRRIEQAVESMEQKLQGRKKRADQVVTFEETGVDFLFVDEAHLFRKLDFATRMGQVRGVDPNGSQMSYDLFVKTRYLEQRTPGRSHVLASGTPITNTMAELYSLQRYQQPQELAARGLSAFDAWAGAFGETVTALEQDPAGGYKPQTRFAKFVNVPELSAMVRQVMDVVTSHELEQYVVRPKIKGGKRNLIVVDRTAEQAAYSDTLARRMRAIEQRTGRPQKGDDILLSVIGDGRKAAIDMRLVDPTLREDEQSKLEVLIDNVARIADATRNQPFHKPDGDTYAEKPFMRGPATQMIFSDLGINGDFPIHRYMKAELVKRAKLKDSEVAIISDFKSHVARQRLFNDMNEGKVRVLIGSVPKMGTGVNAQKRLYALHNLDPQWYPANDEQRNGRALRQGNMNPEIEIVDYSTEATYDSTMWGMMARKAGFIEGFMRGDPTMRTMEDLGEASQYEQAQAMTTADPRIMELTQNRQDLERALLRKASFERELYTVRQRVASAQERIERAEAAIPQADKDIAQRQDITGENFTAKVGTETFDDREAFGEAVLDRMNEMASGLPARDKPLGEIGGFKLTVDVSRYGRDNHTALYLNFNGGRQEKVKTESATGIASSAGSTIRNLDHYREGLDNIIAEGREVVAEYEPQTHKTFAGQPEIDALQEQVNTLEGVLSAEAAAAAAARAPGQPQASITENPANAEVSPADVDRIRSELMQRLEARGLADRVLIEVGNKLMLGKGVQGRYWNGLISVALDVSRNPAHTFDHETIHAMRALKLFRPSEWTALVNAATSRRLLMAGLKQRYPNLTAEQLEEEAVAERFADWMKGNEPAGFIGTAVRRVRGFFESLADAWRAVRGDTAPSARAIMQDIESGAIGGRDTPGTPASTAPAYSMFGDIEAQPETVSEILERDKTLIGRLAEGYEDWRIAMQDRMLPVLRGEQAAARSLGRELQDEERPYQAEELMSGRVGSKIDRLSDELVEPMFAAMEAEKITAAELESYLYARHAPERNAHIASINEEFDEGTGSGMTDIEAAAIMARIKASGRMKAFEQVAERVDAIIQFARDEKVEAGLLSEEQANAWAGTYKHYVPLRGFAEIENGNERPNLGGQGITVRGPESKRAFGRRSKAADILAHVIMQAEEAIVRGEKNRVARAFYDLAKAAPDPDFWKTNKVTMKRRANHETGLVETYPVTNLTGEDEKWTVSLKIDGKQRRVTLNKDNPQARKLAEAMRRLEEQQVGAVLGMLSKINRWLSSVNTSLNPDFVVTNAFRDLQTAVVNAAGVDMKGLQTGILKDYRKALFAATKGAFGKKEGDWGQWWERFNDAGGRVSYNQMQDLATLRKDLERRFSRRESEGKMTPAELGMKAWGQIKAVYGFIDKVNTGVENAVRLAAFKNAVELGATEQQAASIAKNLTVNFNRRGSQGVMMNALYLFYNASIQGSTRLLLGMKSPKVRRIVYGIVAAGALQEIVNQALSGVDDDDEKVYDKIAEFEKSRNIILMVPGPWGEYLKIPMPWGYNAFHTLGRNIVRAARGERFGTVAADTAQAFVDAFNPIGGASLLNTVVPTLGDPLVDLTLNRDFADRPIMPDQSQFGPQDPDNQRYWNNVNPVWKAITDALNTGSGGDDVVPGAIDMSPETFEYLFGVVTGGAGATVDRIGGGVMKLADGDPSTELTIDDIPVVRRVAGKKPVWYDKAAFYARLGEVEQLADQAKTYAERGNREGLKDFMANQADVLALRGAAKAARKQLRALRQGRNMLELGKERGTVDSADYASRKAALADLEKQAINRFNKAYIAIVKQPLRP